jgi:PAS domain S-box-containing protein
MTKTKILIVEDEAIIAMEIKNQLQSLGYEVTSDVDTGEDAIQKAEEDKPDLILMDIRIKGVMDGIETAEIIRNRFGIPVIFSTAYLDKERIERAKITMPFGYVLKPIQERDLKVTLEMALYVSKVDIERRKTEAALKESEKRLNRSEKIGKIGNYEYDLVTGEIIWSDQVFDLYERDPKLGPPSDDEVGNYYSEEDHLRLRSYIQQIVETGEPVEDFECPVNLPSGRTIICIGSMFPIKDSDGTVIKIYGVLQDITMRKQAVEAFQGSEEKHRILFETMALGVVYQDADGKITNANPAAERILGLSLDQMQGRTSIDPRWKAIHEDGSDFPGETHPGMVALKTGKEVNNVVMGVFHPEKEEHRWININAVPKFKKGESTSYENFVTFDDITELKTGKR